jgi:hypothetical protein
MEPGILAVRNVLLEASRSNTVNFNYTEHRTISPLRFLFIYKAAYIYADKGQR